MICSLAHSDPRAEGLKNSIPLKTQLQPTCLRAVARRLCSRVQGLKAPHTSQGEGGGKDMVSAQEVSSAVL